MVDYVEFLIIFGNMQHKSQHMGTIEKYSSLFDAKQQASQTAMCQFIYFHYFHYF